METQTRLQETCPPLVPPLWVRLALLVLVLPVLSGCHSNGEVAVEAREQSVSATQPADAAKKIDANLLELERRVQKEKLSLQQAGKNMAMGVSAEGIKLEIVVSRIDGEVEKQLAMPGVTLHHVSRKYNRISASVADLALLHELAKLPQVVMISPQYAPRTH